MGSIEVQLHWMTEQLQFATSIALRRMVETYSKQGSDTVSALRLHGALHVP